MKITLPLTKEKIKMLKVGDKIYLSGVLYTARDAAHKRLIELMDNNSNLPFDLYNQTIYYTGPTPSRCGHIGSCGPTTSFRMDGFMEPLAKKGLIASIGKGERDESVISLCKKYQMIYLVTTGGAGALLSNCVTSSNIIAFHDLGCEAIRKLTVKDFPCFVAYDIYGNSIFKEKENERI